eukprot:TRINITY_DN5339_c0_g1_i1.p1 TRINITY_DN5339_c0_g1~~TRINITY_DN5339_c0_g1_i1.p1  ORF type:complete len:104 (+),score=13.51 TRINITY_DN5339_c0_g1_i1:235-546(+)
MKGFVVIFGDVNFFVHFSVIIEYKHFRSSTWHEIDFQFGCVNIGPPSFFDPSLHLREFVQFSAAASIYFTFHRCGNDNSCSSEEEAKKRTRHGTNRKTGKPLA